LRGREDKILTGRGTPGCVLDNEVSLDSHGCGGLVKSTEALILVAIEDGTRQEDGMRGGEDGTKGRWG
jgi:hypothetical protein